MELFYRKTGEGPPLIIIHGLYGSSDNWVSISNVLSRYFEVFSIDLRNHGNSPHSEEFGYSIMTEDLMKFIEKKELKKVTIIGHSMGGKVAMNFAIKYPERVSALVVVDISPKAYSALNDYEQNVIDHLNIINGMKGVDLCSTNRKDIEKQLKANIPSKRVRQFILKNLKRCKNSGFRWKLNLSVIANKLPEIMGGIDISGEEFLTGFPVLFLRGEKSTYVLDSDFEYIKKLFPQVDIETIPDAGHWLHAEQPELFIKAIKNTIIY